MVKTSFLFSAIAATFVALTQTVLAEGNSDVLSLTAADFDKEVLNENLVLVEFYAPWCGHCKALAPEYEQAATALKAKGVKLAKVDCTENQDLCQEYDVRGYPTLKLFKKGATSDYKGARKADGIVSYMEKQSAPAVVELNAKNFNEFKDSDRVVVVGYAKDAASQAVLNKVADQLRDDFYFGLITDEALAKEHKVTEFPSIVLYKQFDDGRSDQSGEFTEEGLQKFIKANSVPLLDEIDASNFQMYAESGIPIAYLFHDTDELAKELIEMATPLAKKYKGKLNFVHIDANKYGAHAHNVALKEQWPAFGIQHIDSGAKYPLDQSLTLSTKTIESFLEEYMQGKLKPTLKTAEAPVDNDGPVKVVVATEFKDIVLDKSKDVFLEVYAPWCGHCKRLTPIWEELGEIVSKAEPSVVIAKLDGTENDIPEEGGFELTGFPTLKFFKASTNEMIDYDGDRSMESLLEFLNTHNSKGATFAAPVKDEKTTEEEKVNAHDEL